VISTEVSSEIIYRFDDVLVDTGNFRVEKGGQPVTLTPRAFDVLRLLLQNSGHVVEKRELFDRIWKENFVSDNALTKVVKELRHAFTDPAHHPRYIETVPKRGYRFIGKLRSEPGSIEISAPAITQNGNVNGHAETAVREVPKPHSFPKRLVFVLAVVLISSLAIVLFLLRQNSQRSLTSPSTIAVLPFKPLNAESRDESLELGMAETLINRLSNLRQIVVRPISSVRRFTDPQKDPIWVGRETEVEAVLDGSIQKVGDRVRITVRLLDVRTGASLWSEQFDDNFTDIFRVQDSIAERITSALALRLSRQEHEQLAKHLTDSPEAYENYLQGQFLWNRRSPGWITQSLDAYKNAVEKDPNFALAHIGIAESFIMLSGHRKITMQEAELRAEPSIRRALELDNNLAQAHNALAELKYQYQYDWRGAEREFKTAIDLNPNVAWIRQAYGWFLMSEGRFDEATVEMERARQLDPSSLTVNVGRGRLYYYSRQYDQAIRHFQNIIASEPNDPSLYYSLRTIYEAKRMYPEAVDAYLKFGAVSGAPQSDIDEFREAYRTGGWNAFLRHMLKEAEADNARSNRESPFRFADIYARLGDKEKAFYWLEKTFDERDVAVLQFKIDPAYDFLRDDPRYPKLLSRIGLDH
jgi:TolB-like protein/DNA-binding winged helix-turn-helix (wHTH) protein